MKQRHRVLGFLVLLFAITYLDRVCISVAGPRMQDDLGIGPVGWGWVTGMFTLSYCLFGDSQRRAGRPHRAETRAHANRAVVVCVHIAHRHGLEPLSVAAHPVLFRRR